MSRRTATELNEILLATQRKLECLSTDKDWGISTRAAMEYDLAHGLKLPRYVLTVTRQHPLAFLRRVAGYRCAAVTYRARYDDNTFVFFVESDPDGLADDLRASANKERLDIKIGICPVTAPINGCSTDPIVRALAIAM